MSNIAFFDLPIYSRMATTLAITKELARRGEQIDCYCFEDLRKPVESAGAIFCELPKMKEAPEDVTLQSRVIEYSLDAIPILLKQLESDRPKLLIFTSKCLWGAVLADLLDVPTVCIHTNFLLPPSFFPPIRVLLAAYPIAEIPKYLRLFHRDRRLWQQLREKYPIERIEERDLFKLQPNCTNLRGDLNIVYTSEEFQIQRSQFGENYYFTGPCYIERNFDPDLPLERNEIENKSIIYVSLGSVKLYNNKTYFFEKCLQAFKDSDRIVVMAVGSELDIESLKPIPSNFRIRNYIPQLNILKHASVFITHGGTNSIWEALLNKVPVVVFPQGGDQYLVANRVEELGLGVWIKQKKIQPKQLRKVVERVMQDERTRSNIARLSMSLRKAGGTQKAVDLILEFKESQNK